VIKNERMLKLVLQEIDLIMGVSRSGFDLREEDERGEDNLRSVSNRSEIRIVVCIAEGRSFFIYIS
jgi:hypothetical protein